ncbi:zinc-dependent alcohol dehydrogenase [Kineococcus sp. SYSU DK003]|uniref:zinc-dependent alcohol dehydrogenase n=1 Tax=Kineococcus sp. SYSU DK003 TaxID=3383124 RepID=UPI003D7E52EB
MNLNHDETTVGAVVVRKDAQGAIHAAYESVQRRAVGPDELLIAPAYMGICGTDVEQLHGRMPETFVINFPHTLGHEWSGTVAAVGEAVTGFAVGDRVLGHGHLGGNDWFGVTHDGAMADEFTVPARMCFPIPDSVSTKTAAVIEPFVCVFTALRKIGGVTAGDVVHVYGLGAIGLSAVIQAHVAGATVVAFDPSPLRRELAEKLGAQLSVNPLDPEPLADRVAAEIGRPLADIVVEASGVPSAQSMALESADDDGRVLLMGVSTPRHEPARLGLVQQRNLTVTSSTGAPPPVWPAAIRYVEKAGIDLRPLVSSVYPLTQAAEAIEAAQKPGQEVKVLLTPDAALASGSQT